MLNLGSLLKGRRATGDATFKSRKKDKAIIHQSVPEEVLRTGDEPAGPADMSWMDSMPVRDDPTPSPSPADTTIAKENQPVTAAKPVTRPSGSAKPTAPKPVVSEPLNTDLKAPFVLKSANPPATERPQFPCGWLVVVEGPGVGNWFVLERGVSHIGSGDGQTVQLGFGDSSVAPECHAQLEFDEARHAFSLDGEASAGIRLNGIVTTSKSVLRDGDVITLGGTSLRLAALCTSNFNWSSSD